MTEHTEEVKSWKTEFDKLPEDIKEELQLIRP